MVRIAWPLFVAGVVLLGVHYLPWPARSQSQDNVRPETPLVNLTCSSAPTGQPCPSEVPAPQTSKRVAQFQPQPKAPSAGLPTWEQAIENVEKKLIATFKGTSTSQYAAATDGQAPSPPAPPAPIPPPVVTDVPPPPPPTRAAHQGCASPRSQGCHPAAAGSHRPGRTASRRAPIRAADMPPPVIPAPGRRKVPSIPIRTPKPPRRKAFTVPMKVNVAEDVPLRQAHCTALDIQFGNRRWQEFDHRESWQDRAVPRQLRQG